MKNQDAELFTKETQAIIYGNQTAAVSRMLDFDYACGRKTPSVAAIVDPGKEGFHKAFFGKKEILLPVHPSIASAAAAHPKADAFINFASFRSAYASTMEALNTPSLRTVTVIAEGMPERRAREIAATAKKLGKWVIGPSTVGAIKAGCFKIGNAAGTYENIVESKLHRPGSVGFVSKSGGLSNECYNIIARATDGLYEGVAIGGDAWPGSSLLDHILRYERIPEVKIIAALGELGGTGEIELVEALKAGRIKKPLVIWVTGTCAKMFPSGVQFGHAGAKAGSELETAHAKNDALRKAGAVVPESFDDYAEKLHEAYERLVKKGAIKPAQDVPAPALPMDFAQAVKEGRVRKPTTFIATISNDRKEELEYNNVPITRVINEGLGIGGVIGLLWFKKELPAYARKFLELAVMLTADHGPAVSGAHNAIVAARAGKDMISSLVSGLLTIGPRFGGAIDDAARAFKRAHEQGLTPEQFVREMKAQGKNIPGIGHRVKSLENPDMRVSLLKEFCRKNFKKTELLDYALQVEKLTTLKKANLILNVDGCIGICFVDLLKGSGCFSRKESDEIVEMGCLNALFVVARSIGLIGHIFDQKRLKQPLYRTAYDEIAYMTDA
ncbi:MAG: citrate/2-methylcitrate synthase [Elusimicrobiota bacterium]|jgi:succinyl-CoA synthetase alpha subunit